MTRDENRVVKILMKRDGMTEKEAKDALKQARCEIYSAAESGDYEEAESIMYSLLGLEMDYLFDVLY